jgi:hypothetical protein
MNDSNEDRVTGDSSGFWRGFAEVLEEDGIPQNQRPYYCRWVQGFFAELGKQEVNANALEAHIKKLVGDEISGWQFRQAVDALRMALCRVGRDRWGAWACKLDWNGWKDLGRDLERGHPTLRRTEVTTDAWRVLEEKFRKPHPDEARALGAIERMVREVARAKDYESRTLILKGGRSCCARRKADGNGSFPFPACWRKNFVRRWRRPGRSMRRMSRAAPGG